MRTRQAAIWSVPPVLFVLLLVGWPVVAIARHSFQRDVGFAAGEPWPTTLTASSTWEAIGNSLLIASLSTLGCLLIGVFMALVLAFIPFRGAKIVEGWLSAVVCFPSFLIPLSLGVLFGGVGVIPQVIGQITGTVPQWHLMSSLPGVILGETIFFTPFVARPVTEALRQIPATHLNAAASLGAGTSRILARIILPAAGPAISASAALTFLLTLNEIGIVLFTGAKNVTTLPMLIYNEALVTFNMGTACALACMQVVLSVGLYSLYRIVVRSH